MHIDTDARLLWQPPARSFQKFQRQGSISGRIDDEIRLECFHVTVRRSVTDTRGDAGVRFTDDVKDSTSALHFDIRQALHLSAQSQLNQWSRHCVGRPAEFNSRPSILSRDLIQHVKTPIDRHCSSPTQLVAKAGKELDRKSTRLNS